MKNQKKFKSPSKPKPKAQAAVFADYARYYDLLYRDKDYAAEAEYVAGLIRKFHPSARSILELGGKMRDCTNTVRHGYCGLL